MSPGAWLPFALCLAVGVPVGVVAYLRFFRFLREDAPGRFRSMGSPNLWNRSLTKSLATQRFIYSPTPAPTLRLERARRFLAYFNPLLVVAVFAAWAWLARGLLRELC